MYLELIFEGFFTLFFALLLYAWQRYIKPWLQQNRLLTAASVAVEAAEALWGRYHGEEKLQAALDQLKNAGWNIESSIVLSAVKAAWQRLNTEQIASGEKRPIE